MMSLGSQVVVFLLAITLLATCAKISEARVTFENGLKSKVYLSPITQHHGSVTNRRVYDMEFPKGHIALKSFDAEVVDEAGNSVSLQETYLHHWLFTRYYERIDIKDTRYCGFHQPELIIAGNAGMCDHVLRQYFGVGSETRRTSKYVPDPYGIEVGNPLEVPSGYEEKWMLTIHAIDTRGTVDPIGCTECRCSLYNVTHEKYHGETYIGGVGCCDDGAQCKLKKGVESVERTLYLKYTVKWTDWSDSIVPVKVFLLDVTDTWQNTGIHDCYIEYDIEQSAANDYITTKRTSMRFPISGDVVYAAGHQHIGGIGTALYKEDGRAICTSIPIYGKGNDVGDEAGYIVGISTCYPKPGSVKIARGEIITLESNYSSEKSHTGVMGQFYFLVAESPLESNSPIRSGW